MDITGIARENLEEKGLPLKNKIELTLDDYCGCPDTFYQIIGRKNLSTGEYESFFTADKENNTLDKFNACLNNLNLVEEQRCIVDYETLTDKNVIDYFVPYDIKESTKNIPTYTEDYVGTDFVMNGSYKATYEILLTAGENITRRFTITHNAVNVPMVDILSDVEEMIEEAFNQESDSDNPFSSMFIFPDEDKFDDNDYCEINMFNEYGQISSIEINSVSQVMSMIVSIRQIGCEFICDD